VATSGGSPFGPGRQSRTPQAHEATGLGEPLSSTRHMRQLPAIESRSWKQKRGISAPAASQAWSSVYSGGTSISLPSTMSLVMSMPLQPEQQSGGDGDADGDVQPHQPCDAAPKAIGRGHPRSFAQAQRAVRQSCAAGRLSQPNA